MKCLFTGGCFTIMCLVCECFCCGFDSGCVGSRISCPWEYCPWLYSCGCCGTALHCHFRKWQTYSYSWFGSYWSYYTYTDISASWPALADADADADAQYWPGQADVPSMTVPWYYCDDVGVVYCFPWPQALY